MKNTNDEFYVGYLNDVPKETKRSIRKFVIGAFLLLIIGATTFALTQNEFNNSSFELGTSTKISGIFHEMPYPMLKVKTDEGIFKNILLLGFGKSSVNPFLQKIRSEVNELSGSQLSIEGNLIYYNGKTLLQVTSDEKVTVVKKSNPSLLPNKVTLANSIELQGEIIDPKCYFGVMKPGKGKIHRSCAALCISGGIPPVLATNDANNISKYYLLTDTKGMPINEKILSYIGKPSIIKGKIVQVEDWFQLQIDPKDIRELDTPSSIY
ncbi:MAG: hypothetical protein ACI828_000756 [Flavobacteriales bacterium]|jgi:hypothetical protein